MIIFNARLFLIIYIYLELNFIYFNFLLIIFISNIDRDTKICNSSCLDNIASGF